MAFTEARVKDLDAKLNFMGRLEEQAPEPGYQWSDFQRTLERFLFVKGRPHTEAGPLASSDKQDAEGSSTLNSKQQQLF